MKKYIIYFFTGIASIWLITQLLSGFRTEGKAYEVLLVSLFISFGVYLTEYILAKSGKDKVVVFLILSTLINFFTLYISTLMLTGVNVVSGSLKAFDLEVLSTPTISSVDLVLTLLIASFVTSLVASITRWAGQFTN